MAEQHDTEVIERVLGGDDGAFEALVERYSARVFSLVCRICASREEAEEVVQDTFLKVYRHLGRFRRESSFSSWLYRIACNTALSHHRKTRSAPRFIPWEEERIPEGEPLWREDDPPQERLARLDRAMEHLPAAERMLLLLFYREERPVREIARILSLSEGQVKTRLHRIRKKLGIIYNSL